MVALHDVSKNGGRTFDSVKSSEFSSVKFWWTCATCGQSFQSRLISMVLGRKSKYRGCSYCSRKKLGDGESFADIHPDLMDEYDSQNTIDASTVFPTNTSKVNWICRDEPNHRWQASFFSRHLGYGKCPVCENIHPVSGFNTFEDHYPDLTTLWSPHNAVNPDEVIFNSNRRDIQWLCPGCNGSYYASPKDMVSNKAKCPFCTGKRPLAGFNTLAVKHPDLVKLWAPDNIRTPEEILPTTLMRFKWLCPDCNGSYYASPKDMVNNKAECPYCAGKKPLPGFNTLAVEYPHLMDEWYFLCNTILVDPDHVLPSSTQKVWWICSNNQSHHYPMPIATRVLFEKRGRESCPYCKGRRINLRHFI